MNDVERMQGQVAALAGRVKKLEILFESRSVLSADEKEAERVAQLLGFGVEIILLPNTPGSHMHVDERKRLARELHLHRGWSATRISRALNCCHRTAQRWIK